MTKTIKAPADPHILPVRVYYEDTDAHGIVYHANYLKFAERGRTEYLRATGFDHHEIKEKYNLLLVIRHIEIDYLAPARLDDMIELCTKVLSRGRTSIVMEQVFTRDGKTIAKMKVTVVGVTPEGKPLLLPPVLREGFQETRS